MTEEAELRYFATTLSVEKEKSEEWHECVEDCRLYCDFLIRARGLQEARTLIGKYPVIERIVGIKELLL